MILNKDIDNWIVNLGNLLMLTIEEKEKRNPSNNMPFFLISCIIYIYIYNCESKLITTDYRARHSRFRKDLHVQPINQWLKQKVKNISPLWYYKLKITLFIHQSILVSLSDSPLAWKGYNFVSPFHTFWVH